MAKQPKPEHNEEGEQLDASLKTELEKLEKRSKDGFFKSVIAQIDSEYSIAYDYMKPRWDEWKTRLLLYNNQRRDKEAVGDPLLFGVMQTVLSSLYNDVLQVSFEPNEPGDVDAAEAVTMMAKHDYRVMGKDMLDYEWDWDTLFFGRGLQLLREFDRSILAPVGEVLNPLVCLRDPRAHSMQGNRRGMNAARFFGRDMLLTKSEMKRAGVYFNIRTSEMGKGVTDPFDITYDARRIRAEAQGFGDQQTTKSLTGENVEYKLAEWYTVWRGKRVLVTLANDRTKVVRYKEIKSDNGRGVAMIPVIDRVLYPMTHDWDGVSIPDLVEDKQRARSVFINLGLRGAKSNLHPMYLYDQNKIRARSDLDFGFNKHVPVTGDPNGAVAAIQRKTVGQEADYILGLLDVAAQRATATPEIQQGVQSTQRRTATETNRLAANVNTRYSLSAKIFGWSETRFWEQWYSLYKRHFAKDIDEKVVRITGALGTRFRKLTKDNIEMQADPDVTITSTVVADQERLLKLQMYTNWAGILLSDPSSNRRGIMRQFGRLSGFTNEDINHALPANIHELKARQENDMLDGNRMVEVDVLDDDMAHMEEHNKAADTPAKYAHIEAHKRAMMFKLENPQYAPQPVAAGAETPEEIMRPAGSMDRGGAPSSAPQPQQTRSFEGQPEQ